MAESVQVVMEGMATELNLLARAGILRRSEVRAVVRKRTRFEHRTRRRGASKADYVRYLQFELRLLRLRRRRIARLSRPVNPLLRTGGVAHIRHVFERAVQRFAGDVALWLAYAAFAQRALGPRAAGGVVGRALRLHPRQTQLWALAARWEAEANGSLRNARALLQRAVRLNPLSRDAYLSYARLELLILESCGKEEGKGGVDEERGAEEAEEAPAAVVARVIAEEAMAKLPDDLELRTGLLGVFAAFEGLRGVPELSAEVARSIEKDFAGNADAWAAVAEWECRRNGVDAAEAVWERAVAAVPSGSSSSSSVWERRAAFVAAKAAVDVDSTLDSTSAPQVAAVCAAADGAGSASPRLYELWLSCAAAMDDAKLAVDVAERATRRWPGCSLLWRARIALADRLQGPKHGAEVLQAAIAAAPDAAAAHPLWTDLVERLCREHAPFKQVLSTVSDSLAKLCAPLAPAEARAAAASFATAALRASIAQGLAVYSAANVRSLVNLALRYSSCLSNSEFCRAAASFEIDAVANSKGRPRDLTSVRELFQRVLCSSQGAAALGRTDANLWLLWHRTEQDYGTSTAAASVYRTARSTLADPTPLLEAFS